MENGGDRGHVTHSYNLFADPNSEIQIQQYIPQVNTHTHSNSQINKVLERTNLVEYVHIGNCELPDRIHLLMAHFL
jgi:hypothetical protein